MALSEVQRLKRLLTEILLYAKPQILHKTELDLNQFIPMVIQAMRSLPEIASCQIQFEPLPTPVSVWGDRDKLQQALINVIQNACEAVSSHRVVRVQLTDLSVDSCNHTCIQIHNHGNPVPPDYLVHLMEPFYSTKPGGTGLGLAIVKRIVEAHEGQISIQSDPKSGTTVSIELPI
ncbi:MAG: hypothetical protein C4287_04205 [Leptolyngbya sp. ERB_1_2]